MNLKNKKQINILLVSFLCSLLIMLALVPVRGYIGFQVSSVAALILYFMFTFVIVKKYTAHIRERILLCTILLGCAVLQLPIRIMDFQETLVSLPDFMFHLLGIAMGYMFYKSKTPLKITIAALGIAACIFIFFAGYGMWLNKLSYGSFSGRIEKRQLTGLEFQTSEGDTLQLSGFRGKYLILDHWYTHCGYCYRDFPNVQKYYDMFGNNPDIAFYAVHSRIEKPKHKKHQPETYGTGAEILQRRKFTFPCLSIDIENPKLLEAGVDGYPTVLIFDRESNLIFRGTSKNAAGYIKKLIKM